jgi:hypothetical protein
VVVTQLGGAPTLTVTATSAELNAAAGSSSSFFIISNTGWTIESAAEWIKASVTTGAAGFRQVGIIATENTGAERKSKVTIKVKDMAPYVIEVTQKAK